MTKERLMKILAERYPNAIEKGPNLIELESSSGTLKRCLSCNAVNSLKNKKCLRCNKKI